MFCLLCSLQYEILWQLAVWCNPRFLSSFPCCQLSYTKHDLLLQVSLVLMPPELSRVWGRYGLYLKPPASTCFFKSCPRKWCRCCAKPSTCWPIWVHYLNARQSSSRESAICLWAYRMLVRCTCVLSFGRSSSGTLLVTIRLCVPWTEPTSRDDMGMQHRQPKHTARVFQPHRIVRSWSVPTYWHHALIPPNLCKNPKTNICLIPLPARGLNRILCGCNNQQYTTGVRWSVCTIHRPPPPHMVFDVDFEIPVQICPSQW